MSGGTSAHVGPVETAVLRGSQITALCTCISQRAGLE